MYALVFMVLGGIAAFGMIYFSIRDGRLSIVNLRALRQERAYLREQLARHREIPGNANMVRTIECFLDMNTRETGTELVDRIGMDTLLGTSSLLVGVGTLMATEGDHSSAVFSASNWFSGYIGNIPCAIYGVANLLWSSYVWARARKQQRAALNYVKGSTRISQMLRNRTSSIQMHAALNGITGIVAGMAALVTATMWWGYVVLAPCVVTSGLVNVFWRRCVGYERPLVLHSITSIDQDIVLEALQHASSCRERIQRGQMAELMDAFTTMVSNPDSLDCAVEVIRKNNMMEEFCRRLLQDKDVSPTLHSSYEVKNGVPAVDWPQLLATGDGLWQEIFLRVAKGTINELALKSFIYQERHLLEVLGCYMCRGAQFGRRNKDKKRVSAGTYAQPHNVHTYSGRHANDWLFGGFSLIATVKSLFGR